eukprot:12111125-Alexandrium_andersonii.AAC.1
MSCDLDASAPSPEAMPACPGEVSATTPHNPPSHDDTTPSTVLVVYSPVDSLHVASLSEPPSPLEMID